MASTYLVVVSGTVRDKASAQKIADANTQSAIANAEAAKANEGLERAKADIATAHAQSKIAEARAAEANLQLEQLRAPRHLKSEQVAALAAAAKRFGSLKFDVAYDQDYDASLLLGQIEKALAAAGWEQLDWKGGDVVITRSNHHQAGIITMQGVFLQMEPEKASAFGPAAIAVAEILNEAGIRAKAEFGNGTGAQNADAIHVLVGKKPL